MAINANLPFQIQRPRVSANALANRDARIDKRDARMRNMLAMENAGQQHQINALALDKAQDVQAILGQGGEDMRGNLFAGGHFDAVRNIDEANRLKLANEKAQLDAEEAQHRKLIIGLTRPETFDQSRAALMQIDPEFAVPLNYDVANNDAFFEQMLDPAELVEKKERDRNYTYTKEKDEKAARAATLALQAAKQKDADAKVITTAKESRDAQKAIREQETYDRETAKTGQAAVDAAELMGEAFNISDRLLNSNAEGLNGATGNFYGNENFPTFSQSTRDAEIDITRLKTIMTKDNLKLMSGILTDNDIKFLTRLAAGGLDTRYSTKQFKAELAQINSKLEKSFSPAALRAAAAERERKQKQEEGNSAQGGGIASTAFGITAGNKR